MLTRLDFIGSICILHCVVKTSFSVKIMRSRLAKSAGDWLQAVADRTRAFNIASVEQFSSTTSGTSPGPYDLVIELSPATGGPLIRLVVEVHERVSPLLTIGILQRIAESPTQGVATLCSRVISERVAELCRSQGVSYFDEAGNCRLSAPNFYLQVEGRKPARAAAHSKAGLFAIKSSRITRVLLGNPNRGWQVQELADEAQVSLGLVAKVKRVLLDQAFIEERNRRVHLRDPKGLLDAWATNYELCSDRVSLYVMQKAAEVETETARWCREHAIRFAATDLAGAWRLRPTVRYHLSTMYVEPAGPGDAVNDLVEHLEAKRVDSGANLVLVLPDDPFVFYQSRNLAGVNVVSPIQLYLDLHKQPGRAGDAAQEIHHREIMPTW
jgi:hypothetical protein